MRIGCLVGNLSIDGASPGARRSGTGSTAGVRRDPRRAMATCLRAAAAAGQVALPGGNDRVGRRRHWPDSSTPRCRGPCWCRRWSGSRAPFERFKPVRASPTSCRGTARRPAGRRRDCRRGDGGRPGSSVHPPTPEWARSNGAHAFRTNPSSELRALDDSNTVVRILAARCDRPGRACAEGRHVRAGRGVPGPGRDCRSRWVMQALQRIVRPADVAGARSGYLASEAARSDPTDVPRADGAPEL